MEEIARLLALRQDCPCRVLEKVLECKTVPSSTALQHLARAHPLLTTAICSAVVCCTSSAAVRCRRRQRDKEHRRRAAVTLLLWHTHTHGLCLPLHASRAFVSLSTCWRCGLSAVCCGGGSRVPEEAAHLQARRRAQAISRQRVRHTTPPPARLLTRPCGCRRLHFHDAK
jgi:hypothetical protein